jgi:hypothetical protein
VSVSIGNVRSDTNGPAHASTFWPPVTGDEVARFLDDGWVAMADVDGNQFCLVSTEVAVP